MEIFAKTVTNYPDPVTVADRITHEADEFFGLDTMPPVFFVLVGMFAALARQQDGTGYQERIQGFHVTVFRQTGRRYHVEIWREET